MKGLKNAAIFMVHLKKNVSFFKVVSESFGGEGFLHQHAAKTYQVDSVQQHLTLTLGDNRIRVSKCRQPPTYRDVYLSFPSSQEPLGT